MHVLRLVYVVRRLVGGIVRVAEDIRPPLAVREEVRRERERSRIPVGDSRRVPRAVPRLPRYGGERLRRSAQPHDGVPYDRRPRHERKAFRVPLVLRRRVAEHLQRCLVERHHRHLAATRADGPRVRGVTPVFPDAVVVHSAGRVVHRTRSHPQEERRDVVRHHVLVPGELHVLEAMHPLVVEDVRIHAAQADRTVHAVVVDDHAVARAGRRELLEEACDLGVAAVHEVDLEALRAQLGKVLCNAILVAVDLRPRHPEDDAHALLVRVVDQVWNIHD